MPLTAANSMPIQTGQVQGAPRPSAAMLMRKPKKKKPEEPEEGTKHWSQTKPSAAMLMRGKK